MYVYMYIHTYIHIHIYEEKVEIYLATGEGVRTPLWYPPSPTSMHLFSLCLCADRTCFLLHSRVFCISHSHPPSLLDPHLPSHDFRGTRDLFHWRVWSGFRLSSQPPGPQRGSENPSQVSPCPTAASRAPSRLSSTLQGFEK